MPEMRRIRSLLKVLPFSILMVTVSHSDLSAEISFLSTDKAISDYDQATGQNLRIDEKVVESVEDGLSWANVYLQNERKELPIYCKPEKLALTGSQIFDMMRRRLSERPDLGPMPYSLTILNAMIDAFPCP